MKTAHCAILYLVLLAGVTPSHAEWCWEDIVVVGGCAVVGAIAAPFVAPVGLGAAGFTAAGIAGGSAGAALMSTYGGNIVAGSLISVLQSAGAAGIGVAGKALGGAVAGAVGYFTAGGNCDPKVTECD